MALMVVSNWDGLQFTMCNITIGNCISFGAMIKISDLVRMGFFFHGFSLQL